MGLNTLIHSLGAKGHDHDANQNAPAGYTILISKRDAASKNADDKDPRTLTLPVRSISTNEGVYQHLNRLRHKYTSRVAALAERAGETHPDARALATKADGQSQHSVKLTDQEEESYWTGSIAIGTPAQVLQVSFDTGSSDLIINPHQFDPSKSSTAENTHKTYRVAFSDGTTAVGDIYHETVRVAGYAATKQAIGVATNSTVVDKGSSGLLGLGFSAISDFKDTPFFLNLIQQKVVPEPLFAFGLWKEGARLGLGHISSSVYTGKLKYSPVDDSKGFWETPFKVNGHHRTAILDTGATLLIGPIDQVKQLFESAGITSSPQKDGTLFGIFETAKLPDVIFSFGGQDYKLNRETLSFSTQGDKTTTTIFGEDLGVDSWVIGDAFLQNVYAVFDVGNKQVGFAPKK